MKNTLFWDITPCGPLKINRRFGVTYHRHLQDRRISRARNQREICKLFDPEDGGDTFPRNVCWFSTDYTASYPRRYYSSYLGCYVTNSIRNREVPVQILARKPSIPTEHFHVFLQSLPNIQWLFLSRASQSQQFPQSFDRVPLAHTASLNIINVYINGVRRRGISVTIVTGYSLHDWGSRNVSLLHWGPPSLPIMCVLGDVSLRGKAAGA
jgi:hypothetical protein